VRTWTTTNFGSSWGHSDEKKQHRSIDEPWEVSAEEETELVRWLHKFLTETMTAEKEGGELEPMIVVVRRMMEADPEKWWAGHHFFWGMWMRTSCGPTGLAKRFERREPR
jgi:hypothetical protein